jgi:D-amino-acid dehydrogenase
MQVTIVGGGVIGLCTAYYLNRQGYNVTIIDEHDITEGCSFGNMGYISPSHFIPLATPGIIRQGIRWMMSSSSPFYIKPRMNSDLIRWGLLFRRSANQKTVQANTPHLNNLLQLSRKLMSELNGTFPGKFDMQEKGCWALYKSEKTGDHEKYLAEQAVSLGLKIKVCNRQQVQEHEPETEVDVAGGILYLDDCHLDPAAFMQTLYNYLQNSGVKFWINTRIERAESEKGRISKLISANNDFNCEHLVVANGSWMTEFGKKIGITLPMQAGKGYSILYNDLEKNLHYPSILVDHRTATAPLQRRLRIGGTMELSGHNNKILPGRVRAIYDAFEKYYPLMKLPSPETSQAWFGYRPVTPDGLPYLGKSKKYNNLYFAGGHAMLGLSAAAASGLIIEEIISEKPNSININAFDPERFN